MDSIDKLKEKDEQALMEVMHQYGDYLLRTAYLLVKDYQTAEEAVQDTFITAFEKIHQLENPEKLKSWLTAIALNQCRSRMRKWQWKNIFLHFDAVERINGDETAQSPEEAIVDMALDHNISEAIQQLDYKYREVITLYYFNEMKISEIAAQTKTNENTVKSRLKRARLLLKDLLTKGEDLNENTTGSI
ncbi:sigma-70 family RNA polymerase sigma factor [Siminovitchia fortis]|uniref:Sigma-70 family RNA polymerase sigma factor n=1 Tax=Siminovitchia fortis TaxID=254758 RepID=A0A451GBX3_9BACI|nr:sigma-70 family RNA polymerase sigma factor [Siminovitchia fortis]RWR12605.1 sigma-70 family RNA polymerase sigma factor [Siminovitchia fortis]WHY81447.1 sigma-70 family RNA polymerase sigma factor [Siminovitchia fortis]